MDQFYDMSRARVVELSGSDHRDRRFVIEPLFPVEIGFCDELFFS